MCNDKYIAQLEFKLASAHYQIKRAIAQLDNSMALDSVSKDDAFIATAVYRYTIESVMAQLQAYLKAWEDHSERD